MMLEKGLGSIGTRITSYLKCNTVSCCRCRHAPGGSASPAAGKGAFAGARVGAGVVQRPQDRMQKPCRTKKGFVDEGKYGCHT